MEIRLDAADTFYALVDLAYQNLIEREDRQVVVHYAGDLNFGYANSLTNRIEKMLDEKLESKKVRRRFFSVFVEAIQNIRLHGLADEERRVHAGITVYLTDSQLCCLYSNMVLNTDIPDLKSRYDEVNSLDYKELKAKYMDVMMSGGLSEKGGAGLGIITMVMRSKNPGPYLLEPIDDDVARFEGRICVDLE